MHLGFEIGARREDGDVLRAVRDVLHHRGQLVVEARAELLDLAFHDRDVGGVVDVERPVPVGP